MTPSNDIVNVDSVHKQFGRITAVHDLSFRIHRGDIFALLGPNGAGKTTVVRMLMGILKPDQGKIEYCLSGSESPQAPIPAELGYLPEERGLYQDIPILKTLVFMGMIRGMDKKEAGKSAEDWIGKLGLADRKKDKLSALSKGNQQKVQFISSVINNPRFAVLDEPFTGFDPINQELFLGVIQELRSRGTTVLLSAHQMNLVERIADRVLLVNRGRKIAYGTVDEIRKGYSAGERLIIRIEGKPELARIQNDEAVEKIEWMDDAEIKISLKRDKSLSGLLQKAAADNAVTSVRTEHVSLHDLFIDRVNRDKGESNEP